LTDTDKIIQMGIITTEKMTAENRQSIHNRKYELKLQTQVQIIKLAVHLQSKQFVVCRQLEQCWCSAWL